MGFPVSRFEIGTQDLKATREFYAKLFEWRVETQAEKGFGRILTGDGIDGSIIRTDDGMLPFVTFYVEVDDIESVLRKAEALGGTVYVPPTPSPIQGEDLFAVIGDPEGNLIGMTKPTR